MPHLSRLAVCLAIEPLFRALHGFEFEHDDALWFPVAFQRFHRAAPHDVSAAVFLYCRAGELLVFLVPGRVGYLDVNDDICRPGWKCYIVTSLKRTDDISCLSLITFETKGSAFVVAVFRR